VDVHSNSEHGARIDFLMCLIEDGYGLEVLKQIPSTVLDIGANQGFFALAARSFFPDATIHCYEPNPRILSILSQNAAAARAEVFREAVGADEGTVFLEESGDSNQARTTSVAGGAAVPQVSLRTAVGRLGGRVDLAKIDCEGAEWQMFGDPEPWKAIRHLRMEYHLMGKHGFSEVHSRLLGFGFEILHHESSGDWGTVWASIRPS
jgi:FkbM family methyltransferase